MSYKQLFVYQRIVIANPIPEAHQLDRAMIDQVIADALEEMESKGIFGEASTPFLLAKVAEITKGVGLAANIQLVFNNAKLAANIAVEYAK